MLGGTVAGYAFYLAKGWETADLVGMTVSLIELSGFFVVLLSGHAAFTDPGRRKRLLLSSLGASTAFIIGTVAATGTVACHRPRSSTASQARGTTAMGAMGGRSAPRTPRSSNAPSSMNGSMRAWIRPRASPRRRRCPTWSRPLPVRVPRRAMPGMSTSTPSGGMPAMPSAGSHAGRHHALDAHYALALGRQREHGHGDARHGRGRRVDLGLFRCPPTHPAGNITWPLAMGAMGAGMQMVTPTCTTDPTTAQQAAAVSLVNQTVSAVAPFESLAAAKAAGYIPITPSGASVVHYANPAYLATPQTLDPGAIEALVYANTATRRDPGRSDVRHGEQPGRTNTSDAWWLPDGMAPAHQPLLLQHEWRRGRGGAQRCVCGGVDESRHAADDPRLARPAHWGPFGRRCPGCPGRGRGVAPAGAKPAEPGGLAIRGPVAPVRAAIGTPDAVRAGDVPQRVCDDARLLSTIECRLTCDGGDGERAAVRRGPARTDDAHWVGSAREQMTGGALWFDDCCGSVFWL